MASLGDLVLRVGARIDGFEQAMGTVSQRLNALDRDAQKAFSGFDKLGDRLTSLGTGLSAVLTLSIAGLTTVATDAAATMDSLTRGLTAVSGSSEEANKQLEKLREVAKLPGLGFEEAVRGSINLQAAGFSASEAENALTGFGNALATVGKGKADLDGVVTALSQIASKGKISAEEINQLAERVPQIREIMKQAFGTADTEVLQKAGIGAQEFVNKVTAELLKLPPVTGGIRNEFENLSDKSQQTFAAIGNALLPAITQITGILSTLLDQVQMGVQWFAQLPEPVRNAAIAFGAVLAVVGPLVLGIGGAMTAFAAIGPAIGTAAGFLGVSTAAFLGMAAAIPLVVAALAALGVWVYQNWEPIKATFLQAWDGISEIWLSIWGPVGTWLIGVWETIANAAGIIFSPVIQFYSTMWDFVGPYFKQAWAGVKESLVVVWDSIKSAASSIWGGIVSVFQTFLEWAAKIPGANKLINLDDAWKSAKKASDEFEKTSKATKNLGEAANKAGKGNSAPIPSLTSALGKSGKAAMESADQYKPLIKRNEELEEVYRRLQAEHRKHISALVDTKETLAALAVTGIPMIQPTEELTAAVQGFILETQKVPQVVTDAFNQSMQPVLDMIAGVEKTREAYHTLGVTSSESLAKQASEAKTAYETIKASGTASVQDLDRAWVVMEERRIAAAKAMGEVIPAETQRALDQAKAKLEGPAGKQPWDTWSKQVSTIITDLSRNITDTLFEGDMSWAEKGKKILGDLGKSVLRVFVEPAIAAINELITGVLTDLIGGKGFGGVLDSIKNVGSAISGVFGGGSGAAGSAGGAAGGIGGIGGGGGSAGGGAASGVGGVAGAVGLASGVVGAVSAVIGNFQMAGMNKSLDIIVLHTLQTANDLANLRRDEWDRENHLMHKLDDVWRTIGEGFANAYDRAGEIWQTIGNIEGHALQAIRVSEDIRGGIDAMVDQARMHFASVRDNQMALDAIRSGIDRLANNRRTIEVRIQGGTAAEQSMANNILSQLQAQGAFL